MINQIFHHCITICNITSLYTITLLICFITPLCNTMQPSATLPFAISPSSTYQPLLNHGLITNFSNINLCNVTFSPATVTPYSLCNVILRNIIFYTTSKPAASPDSATSTSAMLPSAKSQLPEAYLGRAIRPWPPLARNFF